VSLLWIKNKDCAWVDHALDNDFVAIGPGTATPMVAPDAPGSNSGTVLIRYGDTHGFDRWFLICTPGSRTRVNGARVPIGVRVLADRDAIALGDRQILFFSSEQLARVLPFPGKDDHTSFLHPLQAAARARHTGGTLPVPRVRLLASPVRRPVVLDLLRGLRQLRTSDRL